MVKIIKQELEFEECLKQRLEIALNVEIFAETSFLWYNKIELC